MHAAFKDFLLFANWTKVAIVFDDVSKVTAQRSLLLQDLLLSQGIDCLARKMESNQVGNGFFLSRNTIRA